ncbi:MAG TPA: hypothetical protein VJ596_10745 [Gemmatimonadaceae bacterium]|nr:hypothetical protein [Gemmatimonadaceae bacterium]
MSGSSVMTPSASSTGRGSLIQRYGQIIVVGGGCYGSYYVRQLRRASRAGVLSAKQVLVVDRDASCAVARQLQGQASGEDHALPVATVAAEWDDFFDNYLAAATREPDRARGDAIVPSPLMPHLVYGWLVRRARQRWPRRSVEGRALTRAPNVPWQRADPSGTHYVSFAEWMCPINCIEPANCPEIRGPRTWSLPPAVRAYVSAERARGHELAGPALLHCTHRAYGVGMFDTKDVLAADDLVADAGAAGEVGILVGTVSHCHGALDVLWVGP